MEKAKQAQLCPGCGVPTQRSEGCRKIMCVCGRVWEWEGDDSSEDGTFTDDGSEEDEVNQAQTALNLIAMNPRASEASVTEAVRLLAEARAEVAPGTTTEGQSPLLLAVQCRHPAAVSALCVQGARATPDVLEEVKLISHETTRHRIEELLHPYVKGDPGMKLPLWAWVQAGAVKGVEALLRNSAHEEVVNEDVLTAFRRCKCDETSHMQMQDHLRAYAGDDTFQQLEVTAATGRLLSEVRQAFDESRDPDVEVLQTALALRADPNAREKSDDDDEDGRYGIAALSLLAMNSRASSTSISHSIEALLNAGADVNIECDDVSTPLLAAMQHRNIPAIEGLCKREAKFSAELLDELKSLSDAARRHQVEDLLWPLIRSNVRRRLPLWIWVQEGSLPAVEALLQNAGHVETVDADVFMALQRCRAGAEMQEQIAERLRQYVGTEEFERLQSAAATRRLLQELREAHDDQRDVNAETIGEVLGQGADSNAQEEDAGEFGDELNAYNHTALQLLVTNTHVKRDTMLLTVAALVAAKADVNLDVSDSPLLSAVQHRCVAGVEALSKNGVKVTQEVLEELKNISGTQVRHQIEEFLQPLIDSDQSLRCPLWVWVRSGAVTAVEALLRNSAHDEDVDTDVLLALQCCRAVEDCKNKISGHICNYLGEVEFARLNAAAATHRLLLEAREAHSEERDLDLDVISDAIAHGANPNAREESIGEPEEVEEEDVEEEGEEDEEDEDDDGDDEEDGGLDSQSSSKVSSKEEALRAASSNGTSVSEDASNEGRARHSAASVGEESVDDEDHAV